MHSYSQFGEDIEIQNHFDQDYKGIAINIGATDGINMDNTLHFEQQGWKVINVEPNPNLFYALSVNRKVAIQCAVGQHNGNAEFKIVTLEGGNQTAISGLELDQRLMKSHAHLNPQVSIVNVEVRTLDDIIEDFPWVSHVDFVSIDTEGTELDVLKGFDIEKWKPKLFIIENNFNDPEIEQYLNKFGYTKFKRNVVNDFYKIL